MRRIYIIAAHPEHGKFTLETTDIVRGFYLVKWWAPCKSRKAAEANLKLLTDTVTHIRVLQGGPDELPITSCEWTIEEAT